MASTAATAFISAERPHGMQQSIRAHNGRKWNMHCRIIDDILIYAAASRNLNSDKCIPHAGLAVSQECFEKRDNFLKRFSPVDNF